MNSLVDKIIIFIVCTYFYVTSDLNKYFIVPILFVLILSSLLSYFDDNRKVVFLIFSLYTIFSLYLIAFIFFIPLFCYDVFFIKPKWIFVTAFIPLSINFNGLPTSVFFVIIFLSLSFLLKARTLSIDKLKNNYFTLLDSSKETRLKIECKNKELLEKQDYEINLAMLHERNRIARDIHDNVGHLLSRAILQLGAIMVVESPKKEDLIVLKTTLSNAMDSIRNSIHNLHEDSISLESEIKRLVDNFTFCNVKFDCNIDMVIPKEIKYCMISIVKESMSNVIKHSSATKLDIRLSEHPAFIQLIIKDNGKKISHSDSGIGLKNISDRVYALSGNVNFDETSGFKIFVSIPITNNNI